MVGLRSKPTLLGVAAREREREREREMGHLYEIVRFEVRAEFRSLLLFLVDQDLARFQVFFSTKFSKGSGTSTE